MAFLRGHYLDNFIGVHNAKTIVWLMGFFKKNLHCDEERKHNVDE